MNVLYLNGTDVGTLGLNVTDAGDWLSGVKPSRTSVAMPDGFGYSESRVEAHNPRTGRVTLATTNGIALATREGVLDVIRDLVSGIVEVTWAGSTRKLLARLESETITSVTPVSFVDPSLEISWDLVSYQGVRIDSTDSITGFSTTPGVVEVGTFFGQGVMWISGAATTPVVTLKDFRGNTVATMTFATLAADEALEVDLYAGKVYLHDAGVRTESAGSLTAASDGFFKFRPEHANVTAEAYPTIEVSSGNGLLLYRRVWRG